MKKMTLFVAVALAVSLDVFGGNVYVVQPADSTTDPKSGAGTEESPYVSLAWAVEKAGEGDTIRLSPGEHVLTDELTIGKALTICGAGSDRTVSSIVGDKRDHRLLILNHPDAAIANLTVDGKGVKESVGTGAGIYIQTAGGVVSDVIVRNCYCNKYATSGGGISIAKDAAALVDSVIVSNCSTHCESSGGGTALYMAGGLVRNSLFVFARKSENVSPANGGGTVYVNGGEMVNCTIADNTASACSGVRAVAGLVRDCIIAGNKHTTSLNPKDACWMGTASCFSNCVVSAYINDFCKVEEFPFVDIDRHDWTPSALSAAYDAAGRDLGAIERDPTVFSVDFRASVRSGMAPLVVDFTAAIVGAKATDVVLFWDWDGDGEADETIDGGVLTAQRTFSAAQVAVGLVVSNKVTGAVVRAPMDQAIVALSKTMYVRAGNAGAAAPYANWDTAAATIADALALAIDGSEIVLSSDTHKIGAVLTLDKEVSIHGIESDPTQTIIKSNGGNYRIFRMENAAATVHHLTVQGSRSSNKGGGFYFGVGGVVSNVVIRDCQSQGYYGDGYGAGIYIDTGSAALVDSVVVSNCAANLEGAGSAALSMASGVVRNSLFTLNGKASDGSGVRNQLISVSGGDLVNCTIARNNSFDNPGVNASGSGRVIGCIIAENRNTNNSTDPAKRTWKGTASCFVKCVASAEINNTCFVEEHPFADAEHGDLTPSPTSKAVDGADLQPWMTGATDILGNPRVSGPKPDIGAVEMDKSKFSADFTADVQEDFSPLLVTFTVSVNGAEASDVICYWDWNGDGEADETIDGELTATHEFSGCLSGVRLVVYNKNSKETFNVSSVRTVKATQKTIYVRAENEAAAVPYDSWENAAATIEQALTMALGGCEIVLSNGTHNVSSPVKIEMPLTVRGLDDDPAETIVKPAKNEVRAFVLAHSSAKITNLTVSDASFNGHGAGVYIESAGGIVSNAVIRNCKNANPNYQGAGIYIASGATSALVDSVVISNCVSKLENCGYAALMMNSGTVRNSLFIKNGNRTTGDGILKYTVGVCGGELVNCTIALNGSVGNPGVYCSGSGRVRNCIIAENVNTTDKVTPASRTWGGTADNFVNCIATVKINGTCNASEHPFVDVDAGDLTPSTSSGAVDAVLDTEDWMIDAKDILGNPRIRGDYADIGAIEREAGVFTASFSVEDDVNKGFAPFNASFVVTVTEADLETVECTWNWGDGSELEQTVGDRASHAFGPGRFNVTMKARDPESGAEFEVTTPVTVESVTKTIYVKDGDQKSVFPYAGWDTATTNLAEAVSAAIDGCEIIIDDGVCRVPEEVAVYKRLDIHGRHAAGTVLRSVGKHRLFRLENGATRVRNLAIENVVNDTAGAGSVYINAGGSVSNLVIRNASGRNGVGVYIESGSAALVDACVISNCSTEAEYGGGGAAIFMKGGEVRNTLCVFNNGPDGSSVYGTVRISGGRLVNCTIASNTAYNCSGVVPEGKSAAIVNTLIADNVSRSGNAWYPIWSYNLDYQDCFRNCAASLKINDSSIAGSNFFRNPGRGDYRLNGESPAKDKGVPEPWMDGAFDLRGQRRVCNRLPDIGAYEYQAVGFSIIVR